MSKFIVGLTGGIGSGKTTVANIFSTLNVDVVNADLCSRMVVEPGKPALQKIVEHFGADILLADKTLDRAKLRSIIFKSPEEKEWLEKLLHPLIYEEIIKQLQSSASPYTILESPLLIETSQKSICNRILVIDIEETQQIQRTMQRDNNNQELVKAIMDTQTSRSARKQAADDIIDNTRDAVNLEQQVQALHKTYLELAGSHHSEIDATP